MTMRRRPLGTRSTAALSPLPQGRGDRMRRREFILLLGGSAVAARAQIAAAQPSDRVRRIGYLVNLAGPAEFGAATEGLFQGLRDLGYVEGRNLVVEYGFAAGKPERYDELAADLVRRGAELIFVADGGAAFAAQRVTRTIPIVFGAIADPVERGLIDSLAHPGGNVTGISSHVVDDAKGLELLKEVYPNLSQIAFVYDPSFPPRAYLEGLLEKVENRGRALNTTVRAVALRGSQDVDRIFAELPEGTQGLMLGHFNSTFVGRGRICAIAAERHLPAIGSFREFAAAGCLMSYGEDLASQFRRGAGYIDKILKGANPADLPVEQALRIEVVVNLKTADALGVTIPPSILVRADEVIE
jgi:putative ABC transport system substrate-binding protein